MSDAPPGYHSEGGQNVGKWVKDSQKPEDLHYILEAWALVSDSKHLFDMLSGKLQVGRYVFDAEQDAKVRLHKARTEMEAIINGTIDLPYAPGSAERAAYVEGYKKQFEQFGDHVEEHLARIREYRLLHNIEGPLDRL